jgi:hypothetical protein
MAQKVFRKMSRMEMYKAAIEYLEFEKAAKKGDVTSSGKFVGGFEGCSKHMQDAKGIPKENADKLCAFIGRQAGKIKFDMAKSDIMAKLNQLHKLQTAGQDNAGQAHLTVQIMDILNGTSYFPTDLDDAKNYDGSVEDVRDGFEDPGNPRLSNLAQKLRE